MFRSTLCGIAAAVTVTWLNPPASAQLPMATDTVLARLTREALAANFAIASGADRARAADARIITAGALPNPMLTVGVMDLTLPRFAFRQSDFTEVDVQAEQTFPWPGTLAARTRSAAASARGARADLDAKRRELIVRVAEAYFRLRYVITAESLIVRQHAVLDAAVQTSTSRYSTGAVSQADPLQARVALARLEADAVDLRADEAGLRAGLGALRGRFRADTVTIAVIRPEEATSLLASGDALHATDPTHLDENPRVTAQIAAESAATSLARAERLGARPEFTMLARYGARPLGADFFTAMVGVRLPVWGGRTPAHVAAAADAEAASARNAVADMKASLRAEWDSAVAMATANRGRLDVLVNRVLPLGEAAVDAALRAYAEATGDINTVLNAEAARYQIQLEIAKNVADHLTHLVMLAQLVAPEIRS